SIAVQCDAMQLNIREACAEEVEALLDLWKQTGSGPSVTDTPEHLRMLTQQTPDLLLVADLEDRLIGSILGGWDRWRGHIYRLAVHPDFRRRGVARDVELPANLLECSAASVLEAEAQDQHLLLTRRKRGNDLLHLLLEELV